MPSKIPLPLGDSDVLAMFNVPLATGTNTSDPITPTKIKVRLDQLQSDPNNPRKSRNPKRESILSSIESVGLDNPPRITRINSDDARYTILGGGNTRLEILNVLYQKYLDLSGNAQDKNEQASYRLKAQSFYEIECEYRPWQGNNADALAQSMRENEERGETLFIEKALAAQKLHELYLIADAEAQGVPTEPLSSRKLATRITDEGGWTVSQSHVVRFEYAVKHLLPHIPQILWAGAGQPLIVKIRSLHKAYTTFWLATELGGRDPEGIDTLFYQSLSEVDSDLLDIDQFRQLLDISLAEVLAYSSNAIMAEIQAIQQGLKKSIVQTPTAVKDITQLPSDIEPPQPPRKSTAVNATKVNNSTLKQPVNEAQDVLPEPEKNIPQLITAIIKQAQLIANMASEPIKLTIYDQTDSKFEASIRRDQYFDVSDLIKSDARSAPKPGTDDIKIMLWWQLFKASREYNEHPKSSYTPLLESVLTNYLSHARKINPDNSLLEVIFFFEEMLHRKPEYFDACDKLRGLQNQLVKSRMPQQ